MKMIMHRVCCKLVELYAYAFIIATALAIALQFTLRQYIIIIAIFYLIDRAMYMFGHGSSDDVAVVGVVAGLVTASIAMTLMKSFPAVIMSSIVVFIVTIWLQTIIAPIRQNLACLK